MFLNEDDFDILFKNNMSKDEKNKYLMYYNTYRTLLTKFIIKKFNLKFFESRIEKSNLKFLTVDENKMDVYQYFSCNELKYFYLRNNVNINRLNSEEKAFLNEIISSNNDELDEKAIQFIENTYKKVIYEGKSDDDRGHIIMYGPDSKHFMAPNDALVLGMRYDMFNLNGLNDEQWKDLYFKQIEFLNHMLKKMQEELNEISDISVNIIQYTDFSIERRIIK